MNNTILSPYHRRWIIVVLGFLSATNPLSTDMYLPAFQEIAHDLHTTTASLSFTLSSYFIGIGIGQMIYGPLLDRFGRKKPLYLGLSLYIIASVGCIFSHNLEELVVWRFLTAVGGCVATVVSMAMVRDLFSVEESPKVFSLLMLVLGVSPLLAPSAGSFVAAHIGWYGSFLILIFLVGLMMILAALVLPESHPGDPTVQLTPGPILRNYWKVFRDRQFFTYALIGGFSFASLFGFIAASPVLLFTFFKVSIYSYGLIFTSLAAGYISGSQVNLLLIRRFANREVLNIAISFQLVLCLTFAAVTWMNWVTLPLVFVLLFGMLLSIGCASPNATALAMAPFAKKAGRASALFNTIQIFLGTVASVAIGLIQIKTMFPIALVFAIPPLVAGVLLYYKKNSP
ncbi:MAG: multidrug effflux MFS transporter [Chthoniobacterales bacterium]|nr:multidrug effflux MFS transporter [Chthoniobacterales bacterium]